MDIIIYLVFLAIGYLLGIWSTIKKFESGELELEQLELQDSFEEYPELAHIPNRILIDIESHDDYLFVYDAETGRYMAHGRTQQEVEEKLRSRFPDTIFGASEETLKNMGML